MGNPVDIEDVLRTATTFEHAKSAKEAAAELGVSMKTVYNRIGKLEAVYGTAKLKAQFPRCYAARHTNKPPGVVAEAEDDRAEYVEPANQEELLQLVKSQTGKPVTVNIKAPIKEPAVTVAKNERNVLSEIRRRINVKSRAPGRPTKSLTESEMKDVVGEKLAQLIYYIDADTLGRAKLSELSQMFKTLFEAKQLLDGKPTTILSTDDKSQLRTLIPKLLREARRRGINLKDVKGEVIDD